MDHKLHSGASPSSLPAEVAEPVRRTPGRRRSIVFVGNCQVGALRAIYDRFVAPWSDDETRYLAWYKPTSPEDVASVRSADIVVEQIADWGSPIPLDDLPTGTKKYLVPVVTAGFLWPFAGQPHPRNSPSYFSPEGPYPAELGDSFLNRMIAKGVPPDEAVAAHLKLDVNRMVNLDRLFEITIEKQKNRDAATGISAAAEIAEWFREEALFFTPYHPGLRFTKHLVTQFFEQVGAGADAIKRMQEGLMQSPFPRQQLPIHPAVGRHFALGYANESTAYRYAHEGEFAFEQYAHRYMRYEWNAELAEGLYQFDNGSRVRACELVSRALAHTQSSAAGYYVLGVVNADLGNTELALSSLRRCLDLDPFHAHARGQLGALLAEIGDLEEAERELRAAVHLEPAEGGFRVSLASIVARQGRHDEALEILQRTLEVAPKNPLCFSRMSQLLENAGRLDDAIAAGTEVVALRPDDPDSRARLARMLALQGSLTKAEREYRAAVDLDPNNLAFIREHVAVLARLNRIDEAAAATRQALTLAPDNPDLKRMVEELTSCLRTQEAAMPESDNSGEHSRSESPVSRVSIDFSASGNGLQLRGPGWSGQEPTHIWTMGQHSTLHVPLLQSGMKYRVTLEVGASLPSPDLISGRLTIWSSGVPLGTFSLGRRERVQFDLPAHLVPEEGPLILEFDHPDVARPCDFGHPDRRELAVCFWRADFDPVESADPESLDDAETPVAHGTEPASDAAFLHAPSHEHRSPPPQRTDTNAPTQDRPLSRFLQQALHRLLMGGGD